MKPFHEMSVKEQMESCDRMLNVLFHDDWKELYLMFTEAAAIYRQEMETSCNWETFLIARAKYEYIRDVLLRLPEDIKELRDDLAQPLSPTVETNEYEN